MAHQQPPAPATRASMTRDPTAIATRSGNSHAGDGHPTQLQATHCAHYYQLVTRYGGFHQTPSTCASPELLQHPRCRHATQRFSVFAARRQLDLRGDSKQRVEFTTAQVTCIQRLLPCGGRGDAVSGAVPMQRQVHSQNKLPRQGTYACCGDARLRGRVRPSLLSPICGRRQSQVSASVYIDLLCGGHPDSVWARDTSPNTSLVWSESAWPRWPTTPTVRWPAQVSTRGARAQHRHLTPA